MLLHPGLQAPRFRLLSECRLTSNVKSLSDDVALLLQERAQKRILKDKKKKKQRAWLSKMQKRLSELSLSTDGVSLASSSDSELDSD